MITLIITLLSIFLSFNVIYPPVALFLFLFLDIGSTIGTATAMPYSTYTSIAAWGGLIGAALLSLQKLYNSRKLYKGGYFGWKVGTICIWMVILMRLSIIINTGSVSVGSDYGSAGPLTLIIVLAYINDKRAWQLFIIMLSIQLGLSIYITIFPESIFSGYAVNLLGLQVENGLLAEFVEENGIIGSRIQGQFANTVSMAMHAALGLSVGISFLFFSLRVGNRTVQYMLVGLLFVIVGMYLLFVSATRGVMIGAAIGIILAFWGRIKLVSRIIILIIFVPLLYVMSQYIDMKSQIDNPYFNRFSQLEDMKGTQNYRIEAIPLSMNAVLSRPFLGWGNYEKGLKAVKGYLAHQGPLSISVIYGAPVGLFACMIIYWAIKHGGIIRNKKNNLSLHEESLYILSVISVWSAVACIMTNGYASLSIIYIILGIGMWPIILHRPDILNK